LILRSSAEKYHTFFIEPRVFIVETFLFFDVYQKKKTKKKRTFTARLPHVPARAVVRWIYRTCGCAVRHHWRHVFGEMWCGNKEGGDDHKKESEKTRSTNNRMCVLSQHQSFQTSGWTFVAAKPQDTHPILERD
jgi:hypothetical protein